YGAETHAEHAEHVAGGETRADLFNRRTSKNTEMSNMNSKSLKNLTPPWQPGQSGNPGGRPVRTRLTEKFVADIMESWEKHGPSVLETMGIKAPTQFADLASRLIPRDVTLSIEQRLPGGLAPSEWQALMEVLSAVKAALPGDHKPGEVAQLVSDALR